MVQRGTQAAEQDQPTRPNGHYTSAIDPADFELPIRDERLLLPQKVCALVFSVSPQAVQQWPVKPRLKRGRTALYYLPDLSAYRDFHNRKQQPLLLDVERARLTAAQADKTEMDLATMRRELIPADEVAAAWQPIVGAIRQKVLALPSKIKTAVPDMTDRQLKKVKKLVADCLTDLSRGEK